MFNHKWGICYECGNVEMLWADSLDEKNVCCNAKLIKLEDFENAALNERLDIIPERWDTNEKRYNALLQYKSELRRKYLPNLTEEEIQEIADKEKTRALEFEEKQKREAAAEAARQAAKVTVTCPYCKSTNCSKISGLSKATSVVLFGIFSQKHRYQWHCNKCNSDF